MEPVHNASGPIVCKRVSGLLTRRVAEVLAATLAAALTGHLGGVDAVDEAEEGLRQLMGASIAA
jgi:hypothetical protein